MHPAISEFSFVMCFVAYFEHVPCVGDTYRNRKLPAPSKRSDGKAVSWLSSRYLIRTQVVGRTGRIRKWMMTTTVMSTERRPGYFGNCMGCTSNVSSVVYGLYEQCSQISSRRIICTAQIPSHLSRLIVKLGLRVWLRAPRGHDTAQN